MRRRPWLAVAVAVPLGLSVPAAAEDAAKGRTPVEDTASATALPALDALVRRIETLASDADGRSAAQALERARWAVLRARAWLGRGRGGAAERSMQSAEAALALAERQVALERTRADHAAALAAAEQAEREVAEARRTRERTQERVRGNAP